MTVDKLKNQEAIVSEILEKSPSTRDDDFILYEKVIELYRPELLSVPVWRFLCFHYELGCPSYESITRTRRKVQEKHPELCSEEVRQKRAAEEEAYIEYAMEGKR